MSNSPTSLHSHQTPSVAQAAGVRPEAMEKLKQSSQPFEPEPWERLGSVWGMWEEAEVRSQALRVEKKERKAL